MSKYTTQLRWPIEQKLKDLSLENLESNWPKAYSMLGLADYPIFDEAYRETLNNKIIRAYYFREIGFETLGQFSWYMRRTMFEIMPYYNQLYESEKLSIEPLNSYHSHKTETFDNVKDEFTYDNETESQTRNFKDTTTPTGSETKTYTPLSKTETTDRNYSRNVFEDTPMSLLGNTSQDDWYEPTTGETPTIGGENYATNVTYDSGTTKSSVEGKGGTDTTELTYNNRKTDTDHTGTGNIVKSGGHDNVKSGNIKTEDYGFRESQAKLLNEYRKTFLNIDLEIVDRLNDLFMGLW